MRSKGLLAFIMLLAVAEASSCRNTTRVTPASSGVALGELSTAQLWAAPITQPGLPNLHKVSDDLYRSAQPTAEGFAWARAQGVKTVINARLDDNDRPMLQGLGFEYQHLPMTAWQVHEADVIQFLRIATDKNRTPILLHCHHGADRAGMLCAVYRVVVQGWSKDQAIDEMTHGGMGFLPLCQGLVDYVRYLDVERLRSEAGIAPTR